MHIHERFFLLLDFFKKYLQLLYFLCCTFVAAPTNISYIVHFIIVESISRAFSGEMANK